MCERVSKEVNKNNFCHPKEYCQKLCLSFTSWKSVLLYLPYQCCNYLDRDVKHLGWNRHTDGKFATHWHVTQHIIWEFWGKCNFEFLIWCTTAFLTFKITPHLSKLVKAFKFDNHKRTAKNTHCFPLFFSKTLLHSKFPEMLKNSCILFYSFVQDKISWKLASLENSHEIILVFSYYE